MAQSRESGASIVIPVFNKVAFTRQCLDRIARHTRDVAHEVIVVDNGSTDGTQSYLTGLAGTPGLIYLRNKANLGFAAANNIGARAATYEHLLFLNNDTLVAPGWLTAMLAVRQSDPRIGIVGIKQLFPYTRAVYHCGIAFTRGPRPIHLYPYADGDAPHVNRQREYQAVNGACMLIEAALFGACGRFDEEYRNGYEDVDLCLAVRQRGFTVVCCTDAHIYHYAQISEGRTDSDDRNLARLASKWGHVIRVDEDAYFRKDARDIARSVGGPGPQTIQRAHTSQDARSPSPYWRGTRVSVVIPVGQRAEYLPAQLQALARQTVLPNEFEAVIVDYGPGEAERAAVDKVSPCTVRYHRVTGDSRAGAARNAGVALARGELILFLDETCVPDDRLLEEHLLAHADAPDPHSAVVGQLAWCPSAENRTLVHEVCAPGARMVDAPMDGAADLEVTRLDIGNASFKGSFLQEIFASGIRFDPDLALAAFQGADLAVRLQPRGLRVRGAPNAYAYQSPPDHIENLLALEYTAGADAVTLFRTHPALEHVLDVKRIPDSEESARRLARHPQVRQAIADFAARTDGLILTLVQSLDELALLKRLPSGQTAQIGIDDQRLLAALRTAVGIAREVYRTRGKVRTWYAADPDTASAAEPLMAAARTIEWLAALGSRHATVAAEAAAVSSHRPPHRAVHPARPNAIRRAVIIAASRTRMKSRLRALDAYIESRLSRHKNGRWLVRYLAVRARVRPFFA